MKLAAKFGLATILIPLLIAAPMLAKDTSQSPPPNLATTRPRRLPTTSPMPLPPPKQKTRPLAKKPSPKIRPNPRCRIWAFPRSKPSPIRKRRRCLTSEPTC